jgi:hypothetical protein
MTWEKYRDSTLKHETQYTINQCMYAWNACTEEHEARIQKARAEAIEALKQVSSTVEFYLELEIESPWNHQEFAREAHEKLNLFRAALLDPSQLAARRELEIRVEEAKWWEHGEYTEEMAAIHIAELESKLTALGGPTK